MQCTSQEYSFRIGNGVATWACIIQRTLFDLELRFFRVFYYNLKQNEHQVLLSYGLCDSRCLLDFWFSSFRGSKLVILEVIMKSYFDLISSSKLTQSKLKLVWKLISDWFQSYFSDKNQNHFSRKKTRDLVRKFQFSYF